MKPIPRYPGYFVTIDGRVFGARWCRRFGSSIRELKPSIKRGYATVGLSTGGRVITRLVHQLVVDAFRGLPPTHVSPHQREIRHLDGNRLNNRLGNLRRGTSLDNHRDAARHGTILRGSRHPNALLDEGDVSNIWTLIREGWTNTAIAQEYKVNHRTISVIRTRKGWRHVGRT